MRQLGLWKTICIVPICCAVVVIASPAQTFTTLVSFDGTNGAYPYLMSLVQGLDGSYYGTTEQGGANGDGAVFKITPSGTLTTLYSFAGSDGSYPYAGLLQATDGNFYGTTYQGGANGYGTVFQITAKGKLTTLHSFAAASDGAYPYAGLVQATDGNFYGVTWSGGGNGYGTVFQITSGGTLTTLYRFAGSDGAYPAGELVQATDGNFYGTTYEGGANGYGTVFKITSAGTLTTLHSFCSLSGCADGGLPVGALVQATDGNFYGTTYEYGANVLGTIFKITSSGTLTTLHSFADSDGAYPYAGLVQATDKSFYGTTVADGANGDGTIFKITAKGTLTTLHSFDSTDGSSPYGRLVQATNGSFYGTTETRGTNLVGTVFNLATGLGPFVETNPTSGTVGTKVTILGNNLKGATRVTFNHSKAKFKVVSNSEIQTSVPKGATTGKVKVKTRKGTLVSNVVFRVTK